MDKYHTGRKIWTMSNNYNKFDIPFKSQKSNKLTESSFQVEWAAYFSEVWVHIQVD